MKNQKLIFILLLMFLTGCSSEKQQNTELEFTESIPEETEISESESEPETETLLPDVPEFPEVPLNLLELNHQDAVLTVEAEHAEYTGSLYPEDREECSNGRCISGFNGQEENSIHGAFMIPAAQHYDITISVRAEVPGTNALLLNNLEIGKFTLTDTEHFTRVTIAGIYLPAGQADISVQQIDGNISIDYFEIANNTELQKIKYRNAYELSDKNASENAQKLMQYLTANYGKKILTGQYASSEDNAELHEICRITGKYPAIRFGDMQSYSLNTIAEKQDIIQASERWANLGGIVGLMWHWDAPQGISSVYTEQIDFSLSDAIPESQLTENSVSYQLDVAMIEDIDTALENHEISEACAAILRDIDSVSEALKLLADKDIPVLWRPLHEASGGWFWWGAEGAQSYRWLWDVLYKRMTEYHQLHNLIWIWNGQSSSWLVDKYDIAAMDIYLDEEQEFNSRYEEFVTLYRMTKHKKILALSECSTVPDVNLTFRDNTIWSFMGLWYGNYLSDMDNQKLMDFYNSEKTITLDNIKEEMK